MKSEISAIEKREGRLAGMSYQGVVKKVNERKVVQIELIANIKNRLTNEVVTKKIYYIYKVQNEILEMILSDEYYKKYPYFMPLDSEYEKYFRLLKTNETIKNLCLYETLDVNDYRVLIDNQVIYENKNLLKNQANVLHCQYKMDNYIVKARTILVIVLA